MVRLCESSSLHGLRTVVAPSARKSRARWVVAVVWMLEILEERVGPCCAGLALLITTSSEVTFFGSAEL